MDPEFRLRLWAFMDLALMRCNWRDGPSDLKRGQFPYGRAEMSDELGLSVQELRTVLSLAEKLGELTIVSSPRGSIGTICHYDTYVAQPESQLGTIGPSATNRSPTGNHSEEPKNQETTTSCPANLRLPAEHDDEVTELAANLLSTDYARDLLGRAKVLGYNPDTPRNFGYLCKFLSIHGLEGIETAISRTEERGEIKQSRGALFAGIIKQGLFDNEGDEPFPSKK